MKINTDIKYTLDDLRMVPQYSEEETRDIPLTSYLCTRNKDCTYQFKLPIISSPMTTVTESQMLARMALNGALGVLHRFKDLKWTEEEIWNTFGILTEIDDDDHEYNLGGAVGVNGDYLERAQMLIANNINIICIDVAHGHHKLMKKALEELLKLLPNRIHVMAGNVATYEGAQYLFDLGVDSIRVGIGPGCFIPGTLINTSNGLKEIQNIQKGDYVYSHTGNLNQVVETFSFYKNESLKIINDIVCTKNHEFLVINKIDENNVDENNIQNYAFWIHANDLNEDEHLLIELEN